jgi:hypothetical protein
MEITGKIIAILDERSGVSQNGNEWKSQSYVIETVEQYPKKCCFDIFGADKIDECNIQIGEFLTVHINIDAREWEGKWYNSIRAWKITREIEEKKEDEANDTTPASKKKTPASKLSVTEEEKDNLPF